MCQDMCGAYVAIRKCCPSVDVDGQDHEYTHVFMCVCAYVYVHMHQDVRGACDKVDTFCIDGQDHEYTHTQNTHTHMHTYTRTHFQQGAYIKMDKYCID